jgi:hypothetical protein
MCIRKGGVGSWEKRERYIYKEGANFYIDYIREGDSLLHPQTARKRE